MQPRPDTAPQPAVESELHIKTHDIPDWSEIARIREHVSLALAELPEALRDAAVMVVSELVENAIKYGDRVPKSPGIEVSVVRGRDKLAVTVVSGTNDEEAVRRLRSYTEALAATNDKFDLYVSRVQSLVDDPEPRSRLGLFRIGVEGAFELSCQHEDGVLRMTATRTLQ